MNVSELFIRRPVMTSLVMAAFLFAGLFGYFSLPVNELPNAVRSANVYITPMLYGELDRFGLKLDRALSRNISAPVE